MALAGRLYVLRTGVARRDVPAATVGIRACGSTEPRFRSRDLRSTTVRAGLSGSRAGSFPAAARGRSRSTPWQRRSRVASRTLPGRPCSHRLHRRKSTLPTGSSDALCRMLRRIHTEVGNGGFGPDAGIASLTAGQRVPGHLADWHSSLRMHERDRTEGLPSSWLYLPPGGCTMEWHVPLLAVDNPVLLFDVDGWQPSWGEDPRDGLRSASPALRHWLWTWACGGDVWSRCTTALDSQPGCRVRHSETSSLADSQLEASPTRASLRASRIAKSAVTRVGALHITACVCASRAKRIASRPLFRSTAWRPSRRLSSAPRNGHGHAFRGPARQPDATADAS